LIFGATFCYVAQTKKCFGDVLRVHGQRLQHKTCDILRFSVLSEPFFTRKRPFARLFVLFCCFSFCKASLHVFFRSLSGGFWCYFKKAKISVTCMPLLVLFVLIVALSSGLYLPHQVEDGTFPSTPPGFDVQVRGSLSTESSKRVPIIVFLHAMLEENSDERVGWFDRLVSEGKATFVLPVASKKFIET
jgi:hypothetical protein